MAVEGKGEERIGPPRYTGRTETFQVERYGLPQRATVTGPGQQLEIVLRRQEEDEPHRVERDEEPLEPGPKECAGAPGSQGVPRADSRQQEKELHDPRPDEPPYRNEQHLALLRILEVPSLGIDRPSPNIKRSINLSSTPTCNYFPKPSPSPR